MKSGIYLIGNIINDKKYIGSAKNINKRWYQHKYALNNNTHDNSCLQNAWNKYGENNFKFTIIEEVVPENLLNVNNTILIYIKRVIKNMGITYYQQQEIHWGLNFQKKANIK